MDLPYLRQTGFALDIEFIRSPYTEQDGTAICGATSLDSESASKRQKER